MTMTFHFEAIMTKGVAMFHHKLQKRDYNGDWTSIKDDPDPDHCNCCKRHLQVPWHIEERPTGPSMTMQRWPWCRPCWESYKAIDLAPRYDTPDYQRRKSNLDPHCIYSRA